MEITLIRHGRPEVGLKGIARANDIPKIIENYNQSSIIDLPPEESIQQSVRCNVAICSNLPRSLKSAEALGFKNIQVSDSIYREIDLPHFKQGPVVLPLSIWLALLRVMSLFGFSKNGESVSMAKKRANLAVSKLIEHASEFQSVVLVGHGFMNYFIAKELISRKWIGPSKPGKKYWEYAVYRFNE